MRLCYYADGRSIHTKRWMNFFADRGHEMFLISFHPLSSQDLVDYEAIGVRCCGTTGHFHLKKFWRSLATLRLVKSVLKDNRIDLLHCHFLGGNAWYAALSGFHPLVITIMGGGDVCGRGWKPNANPQEKLLTPYTLKKVDFITSWSHLMAQVVRPFCPPETPIEVIHGGVHLDKFFPAEKPKHLLEKWRIPPDAKIIFSPRLMRPLSNIDKIAEAFVDVCRSEPDVYLVVAAPSAESYSDYENNVKEIIGRAGFSDRARFVGALDHTEIADYFRLADVTVSIPDTDGTPMTVLESMACETPTVIGNLADYDADYFEHEKTTLMVDVKNPSMIAEAILRLLQDADLSDKIALEARRRVQESGSYEFQMSKMERIYLQLIKK